MEKKKQYRQEFHGEKTNAKNVEKKQDIVEFAEQIEMTVVVETKWERKLNDNLSKCLECNNWFNQDRDIQLCDCCIDKYNLELLWKQHDNNEVDALKFNESKFFREKYRKKEE